MLGAVRVMATYLFLLSFLYDYHLQLDREKKVMFKLAQQLSRAELHKLGKEVHNDHAVYGYSLHYVFVKPS